ncbi:lysophospholipase [Fistulina hepatica ATCC 64428]|uniref:Lysophospholipase n=1 Tax=Fistulina hepatica ATCC 64428 TaxID=1128425 RepID=A0A0D7AJX0_9AGAR|nr:lysophospholipase [Fistulina hepatica ATCC 64428]
MIVTLSFLTLAASILSARLAWATALPATVAYTPSFVDCPDGLTLVRNATSGHHMQTLSTNESAYVSARRTGVLPSAWRAYLSSVEGTGLKLPSYVSTILDHTSDSVGPNLAIASSGGGYRAAIFGAGVLNALDGRNASAAATYFAGLSGSSWLVTSLAQADFPTISDVVFGVDDTGENEANNTSAGYQGWLAQYDLLTPGSTSAEDTLYVELLLDELSGKYEVGFPVTLADLWARSLSRHFVNGTAGGNFFDNSSTHGAGILFSNITSLSSFVSHSQPFPIIVSDLYTNKEDASTLVAEFNPYEMGSWDPMLSAFTPMKYLGTINDSQCVTGYDQAALIAGFSSELFNEYNTSVTALESSDIGAIVEYLEEDYPESNVEYTVGMIPNVFYGLMKDSFISSNQDYLMFVDGGENGEVIPLQPLLVRARDVDVILAIDATADTDYYWTEGSSLIHSQNRTTLFPDYYSFPTVPRSVDEFVADGLNTRPTFFGCDEDASVPLIIYIANGAPPRDGSKPLTNTSTTTLSYEPSTIQAMLDQTFTVAIQGHPENPKSLIDEDWPACLACAVVDRARARGDSGYHRERSGICSSCFERYCWSSYSRRDQ